MDDRIVRIGTLGEFTGEVRAPHPVLDSSVEPHRPMVRLRLLDQLTNGHSLPAKVLELHLQGPNDSGELLWLMESHEITGLPDRGPATLAINPFPQRPMGYEQMLRLRDMVKTHLEELGYEVRGSNYGFHKDIQPIWGEFECVR